MKRLRNLGFFDFLQGPPKWVPILGELQKTLQKGEYLPLHPLPMFESNFVQVTHQGGPVYLHHDSNRLTMGVASTLPSLGLPDILLIARPPEDKDSSSLILTRMIPMDLVHLYVHDLAAWRLKLRLATGRYYYLELDAPYYEGAFLFDCWIRLINQLREPASRGRARTPHELRPLHLSQHTPFASTWRLQAPSQIRHHPVAFAKYNLPYKQLFFHKRKAKVLKRTFKSQAVGDSVPIWSHLELTESRESPTEKQRSQLEPAKDSGPAEIPLSEKPSITIRTIFSIISTTVNQKESSKGHSSEPGEVTICVTPPRCISQHSPAFSSVVAYDQLEQILWKQDIEDLMDTQSTTLTSSFSPNIHSTAFHRCTPYPSILGHKVKVPRGPVRTQKVRRIPRQKVPPVQSQKAPPSPSQKVPPAPIIPPSAPNRKAFFLPTSSQKALTSPAQYQRAFSPPPSLEKTPAEPSLWLAGSQRGDQLEGRQPEARPMPPVMVSTQKKDVVERRTQEKSLELPFSMTKKTSEEVLVSRTREMTIEELKGTGKSEERVIKKKEETTMDLPGLKSKGTEQRKMWVQTTELSLQGPPAEHRRPLSVEGLALAKLMIMARSQEQHSRPAVLTLPSWLSINAERPPVPQVASMSPKRSQLSWLEGSPVVVREQPEPVSWVEQSLQHWMGMEESRWSPEDRPRVSLRSLPASNRPSLEAAPKPPIPLPATKWEDLPQSTTPLPTPRVEVLTRSPQQLVRVSQEPIQMSNQQPLAMMGTSPDILLPLILETKGGRDTAGPVEVPAQSRYLSASQPSLPS
ncbi:Golgi-associated RAB2 interactor protein 5B [Tenrec ecaudatus]|uniref:Golgi-associated RAB2 interactor protein 5B n=1 Tax=Tenrec ecaudatus TaxID=94439 RepID=UPI003F5AB6BB